MTKSEAIEALPFARSRMRRGLIVGFAVVVAALALVGWFCVQRMDMGRLVAFGLLAGIVAWGAVVFVLGRLDRVFLRGAMRRAVAANYRLCPRCAYEAPASRRGMGGASPGNIVCPECGASFEPEAAAGLWRAYLG